MWEVLKCRLDLVLANKKEMFMDNFRQKASEAAVLLRSRSFLVTMLAAITGFLTLWITLSADAVYIRVMASCSWSTPPGIRLMPFSRNEGL